MYKQIDDVIHGCFDKLAKTFKIDEKQNVAVEFDRGLDLYERCRIPISKFVSEITLKWGGYCYNHIIADLRLVDNNIIFRLAKNDYIPEDNERNSEEYYLNSYAQLIEPIVLPVNVIHNHNLNIKVTDISEKSVTFTNPDKVEYLTGTNSILIEKDAFEYVIAYAHVIKYAEDVYKFELRDKDKKEGNSGIS